MPAEMGAIDVRFGCCGAPERLNAVKSAGYDYAEMPVRAILPEEADSKFAAVRRQVQESGLPVEAFNVFIPPHLPVVGDRVDKVRLNAYLDTALGRMRELGAETIVFGSGGARSTPRGFDEARAMEQIASFLEMVAPKLEQTGITLAIEPLYKQACDNINTVGEALAMARRVSHPRIKVLADLFHMVHEDDPVESVVRAGSELRHVHVPVPPLSEKTPKAWDEVFPDFVQALRRARYDGRVSVEDNGGRFQDFEPEARAALEYLKEQWTT